MGWKVSLGLTLGKLEDGHDLSFTLEENASTNGMTKSKSKALRHQLVEQLKLSSSAEVIPNNKEQRKRWYTANAAWLGFIEIFHHRIANGLDLVIQNGLTSNINVGVPLESQ